MPRKAISTITGYTRRTRDSYIQKLQNDNIAFVKEEDNRILVTQAGLNYLGPSFEPLPSGIELQAHWLSKLPTGEAKILQLAIDAHPQPMSRDDLSEKTGYTRRTRDSYIQKLVAKELLKVLGTGMVKASDDLFDE